MGGFSLWHILIFAIILLLLFGGNRFSAMMGDVAKGLKSFKQGMSDEDDKRAADIRRDETRQFPPPQPPIDVTPQPRAADPIRAEPSVPPTDDSAR
ncbi:MAG: twin-arginine translocase TatA/TatE family subunit [Sphingomicrobium sp.]